MRYIEYFAKNLQELLIDNSLSMKSFAEKLQLNLSECYKYQRKEYLPNLANIIKIADFFECSIDYLLVLDEFINIKLTHTPPFSNTFKKLLKEKNITRYQLSKHTKISNARIDDWFHGRRLPSLDNLIKLAQYFNCSLDTMLGRY